MAKSSTDRLDGTQAEAFLSACFAISRDAVMTTTFFEPSVRALDAAYSERPLLPAPTLALDLTPLLFGERLLPIAPPAVAPVRDALRGYEDHVLARLTGDRRWNRLMEAVASAPKELRPSAVGMVVAQVLNRLQLQGGTGVSQAILRRFTTRPTAEVLEIGRAALFDVAIAGRIAEGLTMLAKAARRTREILSDAEVFLVENIAALKGLGPRVALAQLADVAQSIEERLPARLRGHVFEDGEAPTQLEEESAYPVGGFSSISTSGSLENLVTSELIYMETDEAVRPDLFDVRFVESELLYYSRDESVAVRRKRALILVFDPTLLRSRVKDKGERYQRLVWALGSLSALVRKLTEWLDTEALTFEVVFAKNGADSPLAEEMAVLELLMREFRERGQLVVREAETSKMAIIQAREQHRGRARIMLFATKMPAGLEGAARPDAFIDASGARPQVHWLDGAQVEHETPKEAVEAWAATTRELLNGLLKKGRARIVK